LGIKSDGSLSCALQLRIVSRKKGSINKIFFIQYLSYGSWFKLPQRICIRIVGLKTVANHSDETQAKFKNLATLQMRPNHWVLLQLLYYFYSVL
jgi:hypothetical protein